MSLRRWYLMMTIFLLPVWSTVFAAGTPPATQESNGSVTGHYSAGGFLATTLAYHPHDGTFEGSQKDATLGATIGYNVTETITLEAFAVATLVKTDYASASFGPGISWLFLPNFYLDQ